MADDLQNYKLQLQQVKAALSIDPENKELQKLRVDLEEVIELTFDLKTKTDEAGSAPKYHEVPIHRSDDDEITKSLLAVEEFMAKNKKKKLWRVGDVCLAKWSDDNQFYAAQIDSINPDGRVNVTFEAYKNRGVASLAELREYAGEKRILTEAEKLKRAKMNDRVYLKKKKEKKVARLKELEEERKSEKNKWVAFSTKAFKNKKAGLKAKSIFATPESVNGRVGVGTCGIGGKPMTEFSTAEKWKRRQ